MDQHSDPDHAATHSFEHGLEPGGVHALRWDRIPQGHDHRLQLWMLLAGMADQIKAIALFQIVGANQQRVGIVGFRRQLAEAALLIGDGASDAGLAPETPA